jgi:hypothetical protein
MIEYLMLSANPRRGSISVGMALRDGWRSVHARGAHRACHDDGEKRRGRGGQDEEIRCVKMRILCNYLLFLRIEKYAE